MINKYIFSAILAAGLVSCSSNMDMPTSKVSGRVTDNSSASYAPASQSKVSAQRVRSNAESTGVQGATVTLAQVQADGTLKTVSTQSVETDANGNFVVETNVSNENNLVVVATKGSMEWQSVVSAEVKSGTTVYSQPLSSKSTTGAEVYARLVANGKTELVSQADVELYLNAEVAAQIQGNASLEDQFISSLEAKAQADAQASSNSGIAVTNSQLQAVATAKADAAIAYETALYNAADSTSAAAAFKSYQEATISAYADANISAETYAKMSAISSKAFLNASASMSSQLSFACAKSSYMTYALVMQQAVEAQFKSAGASSAQSAAVVAAGASLSDSIEGSVSMAQITNAFAQYHSAIVNQLKLTLSTQASSVDSIETSINGFTGFKATLNAAIQIGVSADIIVNAYVTFYNSIKTLVQTSLSGASSTQVSAAANILVLANIYN